MRFLAPLFALLVAACDGGGGTSPTLPQAPGWTPLYSKGIARCDNFDFGELYYCVKQVNAQVGQTIRMTFTLSGDGTLYPMEAIDSPPATLRLFVSSNPSGSARWWCPSSKTDLIVPGTYSVSCKISAEWTGVYGIANDPPVGGINYVGYTMGGQSFAGHGVAARGHVHMTMNAYDVVNATMTSRRRR